jgi:hypothetical protein
MELPSNSENTLGYTIQSGEEFTTDNYDEESDTSMISNQSIESANARTVIGQSNSCTIVGNCGNFIAILNGSSHLIEFGLIPDPNTIDLDNVSDFSKLYNGICPTEFPDLICAAECCDYKAAETINYINGDLVIKSPKSSSTTFKSIGTCVLDIAEIFPNLIGINGSLYIINTSYKKICGFDNLEYVTGDIIIANNPNLTTIPTFPCLHTVARKQTAANTQDFNHNILGSGRIIIANNPLLKKIIGFEIVKLISKGIYIMDNNSLTDICGFVGLLRTDNVIISRNPLLEHIFGFCYLQTINQCMSISCNSNNECAELTVDGFHYVNTIGSLIITSNTGLKLVHFKLLAKICGDLIIVDNPDLVVIDCDTLLFVGGIFIVNNESLLKISFDKLLEITNGLVIGQNNSICEITTFNSVNNINNGVLIFSNSNLKTIKSFDHAKFIGSKVYALDNDEVTIPCPENDWGNNFIGDCNNIGPTNFTFKCDYNVTIPCGFGCDICLTGYVNTLCGETENLNQTSSCTRNEHCPRLNQFNVSILIYDNDNLDTICAFECLENIEGHIFIVESTICS